MNNTKIIINEFKDTSEERQHQIVEYYVFEKLDCHINEEDVYILVSMMCFGDCHVVVEEYDYKIVDSKQNYITFISANKNNVFFVRDTDVVKYVSQIVKGVKYDE